MGKRPEFFTDNIDIVTTTGILGFFLGSILKTEETKHNFKNNTSLAIYTDKKAANVSKRYLKKKKPILDLKECLFFSGHLSIMFIFKCFKEAQELVFVSCYSQD